ncbi:hypothetical protein CBM2637_B60060 [Cupriavidus taiwanensis]|nr:hypothetical protein CBM2637_B60060 [Cupriavidus taiwanensis]SPA54557.1 protein of unknown function [Cupriavidus taiwanensis]
MAARATEAWGGHGPGTSFVRTKRRHGRLPQADDGHRCGKADDIRHPNHRQGAAPAPPVTTKE